MTTTKEHLFRNLGSHERYCSARHNIGFPPVLCIVAEAKGDTGDVQVIHRRVGERLELLIDSAPLLTCHVHGNETYSPQWARRGAEGSLSVNDVLMPVEIVDDGSELQIDQLTERMMQASASDFRDLHRAPLWRVRILHDPALSRFAVVLQTHHIITDGKAMSNIFHFLMRRADADPPRKEEIQGTLAAFREGCLPITNDEAMDTSASAWWIAMRLSKLLLLPRLPLPALIRDRLVRPKAWPQPRHMHGKAIEAKPKWCVIRLHSDIAKGGSGILAALKASGLQFGVKTINPVIHSAGLVALMAFLRAQKLSDLPGYTFTNTAVNERKAKEWGTMSGNYVSVYDFAKHLTTDLNVWQITREFGSGLVSPAGLYQRSRTFSLMPDCLGWIGDWLHTPTPQQPTTYETHFSQRANDADSYDHALAFSNLGLLTDLDRCIVACSWSQVPRPFGEAFNIDAVGCKADDGQESLSITVSVREGVLCRAGEESVFVDALRQTIYAFAHGDVGQSTTLGDLLARIDSSTGANDAPTE